MPQLVLSGGTLTVPNDQQILGSRVISNTGSVTAPILARGPSSCLKASLPLFIGDQ
jgi:hypothetical protein